MAQAEFHIFDGGLFKHLQLTLGTIVKERGISSQSMCPFLSCQHVEKISLFCKVGSRHTSPQRQTSVGCVEKGWLESV